MGPIYPKFCGILISRLHMPMSWDKSGPVLGPKESDGFTNWTYRVYTILTSYHEEYVGAVPVNGPQSGINRPVNIRSGPFSLQQSKQGSPTSMGWKP